MWWDLLGCRRLRGDVLNPKVVVFANVDAVGKGDGGWSVAGDSVRVYIV